MTITLDEIICVSRGTIAKCVVDKITENLSFGLRKPKREKIKFLFEEINNKNLWHYVQTELIFFKNDINNVCFFNHSKENFEQFLKNLEFIVNGEYNKIKNIDMNYKKYMKIFEENDIYALLWHSKKESFLKAITPVLKTSGLRKLEIQEE